MKCTKCGTEFDEGIFCPECGTKVVESGSAASSNISNDSIKPKKKKSLVLRVITIVGVVFLLFIALCLMIPSDSSSTSSVKDDKNKVSETVTDSTERVVNASKESPITNEVSNNDKVESKENTTVINDIYGVYSQEYGKRVVYAEVGYESGTGYDYLHLINSPFAENEPDEDSYYQLYTEDGKNWYGVDSKCYVYLSGDNELKVGIPGEDWTLYKQPEGTKMPEAITEVQSASELIGSSKIINPDYMGDPGSYLCSWSDTEYMTEDQLQLLDYYGARLVKNEIFARHGRRFNSEDLQEYFNEKTWYYGQISPDEFNESVLNDYEKENIKVIDSYMEKHPVQ